MCEGKCFEVLIIGSGIAGLSSAVKLSEAGIKVGIITREEKPEITNTYYAQGGIVFSSEDDDSLVEDIQKASSYTSNPLAAEQLKNRSGKILSEILINKLETPLSKNLEGDFKFTKEAAHSKSRILYKGDYTGKSIQVSLLNYLSNKEKCPTVEFLAGHTAIDLITATHHGVEFNQRYESDRILGAYVYNRKSEKVIKILAGKTILATGGIGSLYLHHSNAEGARGDGLAMARRAGAFLTNMEFIQFHPTTFFDGSSHRRFLISEAVRGEGGILTNSDGVPFMEKYHPDKELAPRDVVARAIMNETIETHHDCTYLDISHKDASWIKDRFPTIYEHCLDSGIDITKEPIPVVPAAHYSCGGIKTDLKGQTNLEALYAVGEVACTGLHGANRLASTSLLEGLTWGYIAAEDIIKKRENLKTYDSNKIKDWVLSTGEVDMALIQQDWLTLKQTMWNYVGLTRSKARLNRAKAMFKELHDEVGRFYKYSKLNDDLIGLRNAVEAGYYVTLASVQNKKSVGCFYRDN